MKLAEGRPLPRRMMAAMAQQDCGQCGYNCHDYADALFAKKEKRLNLCVPGGKDTARMLKQLYQELDSGAPARLRHPSLAPAPKAAPGRSRDNPVEATLPVAPATQQRRLQQGNLAHRIRSRRMRPGLRGRRQFRHLPGERPGAGRRCHCGARRAAGFPDRRARRLREVLDRRRLAVPGTRHAVPAHLLSSPAASGGRRRRSSRPDRTRTAMPPPSTCSPPCRNFPTSGPIRKPSSNRSMCCSRASIRFPRR